MLLCWMWKCPFGQFTKLEYFKVQKLRLARISDDIFKSFVKSIYSVKVGIFGHRDIFWYTLVYTV